MTLPNVDLPESVPGDPNHSSANPALSIHGELHGMLRGRPWVNVTDARLVNGGAEGDGVTNDTLAIQDAIDSLGADGGTVVFPPGSYLVSDTILPASNCKLLLHGATITFATTTVAQRALIRLNSLSNVEIHGGVLDGNRGGNATGALIGIFISGGSRIRVVGTRAINFPADTLTGGGWGDGFYVTGGAENVDLVDISADNNVRQGISVISARGLRIIRPHITNTVGTNPGAAIDLEPNANTDLLIGIRIIDMYSKGNGRGFNLSPNALDSTSEPIDVLVDGLHDENSQNGGLLFGTCQGAVKGSVVVRNPYIEHSVSRGIMFGTWEVTGPHVSIERPTIRNCNTGGGGFRGIAVELGTDAGSAKLGNWEIIEPTVVSDDAGADMERAFLLQDPRTVKVGLDRVYVIDPLEITGLTNSYFGLTDSGTLDGDILLTDRYRQFIRDVDVNEVISSSASWFHYENTVATGTRMFTLPSAGNRRFTFRRRATQNLRIKPHTGGQIQPFGTGVDKYISLDSNGAYVTLFRPDAGNVWYVETAVGTIGAEP